MTARRLREDDGAILVIAIIIVTTVALVVGAALTRGDGSLRATVALREVAGSTYAADGAAQVAINNLRKGHWTGDVAKPADWLFHNDAGTGCFGYNTDGSVEDGIELRDFYPASKSSGDGPTSAYVTCTPEVATGAQGAAVPISNANKPGTAVLTLGSGGENGFTFKANGSGAAFRVRGGVWSDSNIVRDNNGVLESTGSIRAHTGCSPVSAMVAPVVNCSAVSVSDPAYSNELDLAGLGIPQLRTPPAGCPSGSVTLQPGYYDDVTRLNALTPNGGSSCFIHLAPGTYYLDFHNNPADAMYDADIANGAGNVWQVDSGTIVGGTLTSDTTVPGRCVNPINDVNAQGVQLIFGGDSRMVVDKGALVELCASYHSNRPPIAIYGQKTGETTPTVLSAAAGDDGDPVGPANVSVPTPATFGPAAAAALGAVGGGSTSWTRSGTPSSATVRMDGFAPPAGLEVPQGAVLTGARLQVTHGEKTASGISFKPQGTPTTLTANLPVRTSVTTDPVDLTTLPGWGTIQKHVHDNGFTGADVVFTGNPKNGETTTLDSVQLELTYYVPGLRGQTTTAIPGNTVATVGGQPLIKVLGNSTLAYVQGTTYTPLASLDLALNNIAESVFRFGVIARSIKIFETGSFAYPGYVIDLPNNSPGWGFDVTFVQLKVYLCPSSSTCSPSTGSPALTSRVQLRDPSGEPEPTKRQVSVLSWSHVR
ncbi:MULTISPECIES: hypothetical protein [unclassified Nocardioides]|uniref:hypothetical protein n=1 Tax=unclassified Nocardioides TaxID=2615069 RepID=UPI0036199238